MDWTGGSRRRFATKKNNSLIRRQRAHFARVRGTVQDTRSPQQIFQPDFLHEIQPRRPVSPERELSSQWSSRRHAISSNEDASQCLAHRSDGQDAEQDRCGVKRYGSHHDTADDQEARGAVLGFNDCEHMTAVTDFVASRKRLLIRSDWLGLSASRPLRYQVPHPGDQDRFGKRRKVSRSSPKPRSPRPRVLTPLFAERLMRPDYLMSGALLEEQVKIKIGTDALASQTLPSRRSQTSVRTSLRAPSAAFDSLSEPMLLGADGDIFSTGPFAKAAYGRGTQEEKSDRSARQVPNSFTTERLRYVPSRDDSFCDLDAQDWLDELQLARSVLNCQSDNCSPTYPPLLDGPVLSRSDLSKHTPMSDGEVLPLDLTPAHVTSEPRRVEDTAAGNIEENDCDDDGIWRNLVRIRENTSGIASMTAVKSSSQHETTPDRNYLSIVDQEHAAGRPQSFSTVGQIGTSQSSSMLPRQPAGHGIDNDEGRPLPFIHLGHDATLAAQPNIPFHLKTTGSSDNGLWKTFVGLGSDDESDSGQDVTPMYRAGLPLDEIDDGPVPPPPASSMLSISGLGTSENATAGGSTQAVDQSCVASGASLSTPPHQLYSMTMHRDAALDCTTLARCSHRPDSRAHPG